MRVGRRPGHTHVIKQPGFPDDHRHGCQRKGVADDAGRGEEICTEAGLAAEEIATRVYLQRGAQVLGRRLRTQHGEIDLIVQEGPHLVFVEVKRRKRLHGFDSPISERQWNRLGCAALQYMVDNHDVTRIQPVCRFDAALVGPDGQCHIIENARTFD